MRKPHSQVFWQKKPLLGRESHDLPAYAGRQIMTFSAQQYIVMWLSDDWLDNLFCIFCAFGREVCPRGPFVESSRKQKRNVCFLYITRRNEQLLNSRP